MLIDVRIVGCKASQFGVGNGKFREATIEADHSLREDEHGPFVYTFYSRKMNVHLCTKLFLLVGGTSFTRHKEPFHVRRETPYHSSQNVHQKL